MKSNKDFVIKILTKSKKDKNFIYITRYHGLHIANKIINSAIEIIKKSQKPLNN